MSALRRYAALAALVLAPTAFAAGVAAQAQTMIEQGQAAAALSLLDQHLASNPQDAEARFARGLALVRLERSEEAIRVFADLTRDYPQLPEPYNNLAVLYAAQGEYEKARDALQAALATHPSYATAHENLGDIYAALAGAAYSRALQLDESNQALRHKLALLNQIDASRGEGASAPAAAAVAATSPPPIAAAPAATPAPTPEMTPETTAPAAAPARQATLSADSRAALQRSVEAWAAAWSAQDLDAYFAAYAEDFVPEGGLSRAAWQAQRRERIQAPAKISVRVVEPSFSAGDTPDRAHVRFRQEYVSDTYSDVVTKVLDMRRTAGGWKIVREYTR
ncbi:YybH family protein [Sinimarinibacterium thermocellulolyticum]|uniref:Tetratricopeptide repeat protein n=1 Tax=Sinimarinibacterium thermocellulolyticum TaxID=3170016 RepID=A0ABV2A712_9GAMM